MSLAETLRELEESLLQSSVRKDAERVSALLAAEFREFGSSGTVYSKAEIIASLKDEDEVRIAMREFICRQIAEDAALVTYRSFRAGVSDAVGGAVTEALRSSLWIFRDARWQMVFHQGTRVNE